jgi:multicomponent Na+:H+ antiporter subunit F
VSTVFEAAAVAELVIAGLMLIRVVVGPTVSDRAVAVNTMSTQATLAVLLLAASSDRSIYLDVALWLCSFSYLATVVWSRYLERGLL